MIAEIERLLSLRKRNLTLTGPMLELYRRYSWRQRSAIVRSWMVWVSAVSLAMTFINVLLVPDVFWIGAVVCGLCIPLLNVLIHAVWRKPRSAAIEGLSIVLWMGLVVSAITGIGALAGGVDMERYLTGTLFVASLAIIVLGIELAWTAVVTVTVVALTLIFDLLNPALTQAHALALSLGYGFGLYAAFVARKTVTILGHHSFLLSLRDRHQRAELALLASVDVLTGISNRRSVGDAIEKIWNDASVDRSTIAFLMVDIDHFKRLNDSCGHAAGDDCIRRVASTIAISVRGKMDIVSRYGGEEFLVVLTEADLETACGIAERIRGAVAEFDIANPLAGNLVTVSIGVAMAAADSDAETVVQWADSALYAAKRQGRNRVAVFADRSLPNGPDRRPALGADHVWSPAEDSALPARLSAA